MNRGVLFVLVFMVFLAIFDYALQGNLGLPFGINNALFGYTAPLSCTAQNIFNPITAGNPYIYHFTGVTAPSLGSGTPLQPFPLIPTGSGGNWFTNGLANAAISVANAVITLVNGIIAGINAILPSLYSIANSFMFGIFQIYDALGTAIMPLINDLTSVFWSIWTTLYNVFTAGLNVIASNVLLFICYEVNIYSFLFHLFSTLSSSLVLLGGSITLVSIVAPHIKIVSSGIGEGAANLLSKLGIYTGIYVTVAAMNLDVLVSLNQIACNCWVGTNYIGTLGIGFFVFGLLTLIYFISMALDLIPR